MLPFPTYVTAVCHVIPASERLFDVEILKLSKVSMFWCWNLLHQHGTGAADGEGIRPETDAGNGWEEKNRVPTY